MDQKRVTVHPALAARMAGPNGRWWRLALAVLISIFVGYLGSIFVVLPIVLKTPELSALFCPNGYQLRHVPWDAIMQQTPSSRNRIWLGCTDAIGSVIPGRATHDRAGLITMGIAAALCVWPIYRQLKILPKNAK